MERVYTITDYYDGPRKGIADFNSIPHYYESLYRDIYDEYPDVFILSPVNDEIFKLAIEDWDIWERWQDARYNGTTDESTHPSLPEDRHRHGELQNILSEELKINDLNNITCSARFDVDLDRKKNDYYQPQPLLVEWTLLKSKN